MGRSNTNFDESIKVWFEEKERMLRSIEILTEMIKERLRISSKKKVA
jgi:hypothetical protein